jgi:hypothetical protein
MNADFLRIALLTIATVIPASSSQPRVVAGEQPAEAALLRAAPGLHPEALHAALEAWRSLTRHGDARSPILTVIDYALPSTNERVAHGKNSGENFADAFSNAQGSKMSSLGAFVTGAAYDGKNGYSVRLRGLDPALNGNAEARAVVLHAAAYVDPAVIHALGRLGRSFGCPAVRPAIARTLIDTIKEGSVLFAWHPSIGAYASASNPRPATGKRVDSPYQGG